VRIFFFNECHSFIAFDCRIVFSVEETGESSSQLFPSPRTVENNNRENNKDTKDTTLACQASGTDIDHNTESERISTRRKSNGASVLLQFISQQQNIHDLFRKEKVAESVIRILETTIKDHQQQQQQQQRDDE